MDKDLISRQALKKVISEYIDEYSDLDNEGNHCEKWCAMKEAEMAIDNARPVEPLKWQIEFWKKLSEKARPKAEWVELKTDPPEFLGHRFFICSKCGREIDVITPDESLDDYPYCHCGARMIKEPEI